MLPTPLSTSRPSRRYRRRRRCLGLPYHHCLHPPSPSLFHPPSPSPLWPSVAIVAAIAFGIIGRHLCERLSYFGRNRGYRYPPFSVSCELRVSVVVPELDPLIRHAEPSESADDGVGFECPFEEWTLVDRCFRPLRQPPSHCQAPCHRSPQKSPHIHQCTIVSEPRRQQAPISTERTER